GQVIGIGNLTVRQFIDNFDKAWLATLLEFHPEHCFLISCSLEIETPGVSVFSAFSGWTSFEFDEWLRNTNEYSTYYNFGNQPNTPIIDNGVYLVYAQLIEDDPYFLNASKQQAKQDFYNIYFVSGANPQPPSEFSIAVNAQLQAYFGPNWTWPSGPAEAYQRNLAWQILRDLYLGHKAVFVEEQMINYCEGDPHDIHDDDWQCLQQPVCESFECPPVSGCDGSVYRDYVARQVLATRTELIASDLTIDTGAPLERLAGRARATLITDCENRCASYEPLWREEIEGCAILAQYVTDILAEFNDICATGCVKGKYWGTSSVPEDVEFTGRRSFEEVLVHYLNLGGGGCYSEDCSPYLINYPVPADQDFYGGTLTLSSEQVPLWLTANEEFLRTRMAFLEEDCACDTCPIVNQSKSAVTASPAQVTAMAVLNRMAEADVQQTINVINAFLDGNTTSLFPTEPLTIPAELNNGGRYCVYASIIEGQYELEFNTAVAGCTLSDDERDDLFADFLNTRLGWDRPWEDYALVLDPSSQDTTSCLICAQPPLAPAVVPTDPPSCLDQLTARATEDAEVAYDLYLENAERSFEEAYRAYCLGNLQESLQLNYKPAEHHYTLYYYDQAGNLAMTVPPAGVSYLPEAEADNVVTFRNSLIESTPTATFANELLPGHEKLTHYGYNNFNAVISSDSPDKNVERTWYDPVGRVVMSESGRQRGLTIAPNVASYTLYDELSRVVEVGEFFPSGDFLQVQEDAMDGRLEPIVQASPRRFVTKTFYTDLEFSTGVMTPSLINSRNRVTSVTFVEPGGIFGDSDNYEFASHYDYDIAGNVATLVQDFKALASINHQYKKLEYDYDLISGNVHALYYQRGENDQFTYRYDYDKINRLTQVHTSEFEAAHVQSGAWKRDAAYSYYDHGPLRRCIMGQDRLQGVDHAYTLQGWIKGINSTIGDDEFPGTETLLMDHGVAYETEVVDKKDLFRLGMHYFANDYAPLELRRGFNVFNTYAYTNYFTGNINNVTKSTEFEKHFRTRFLQNDMDQLGRTVNGFNYPLFAASNNDFPVKDLYETPDFDADGNILSLVRSYDNLNPSPAGAQETNTLSYNYLTGTNLLTSVAPSITGNGNITKPRPFDFMEGQQSYMYDGSGNLLQTTDAHQNNLITDLTWNPYGKVQTVIDKTASQTDFKETQFRYGPDQNRWAKSRKFYEQSGQNFTEDTEFLVRDAQGNTLAVYDVRRDVVGMSETNTFFHWRQQFVYGSSRLGLVPIDRFVDNECDKCQPPDDVYVPRTRHYELSDHLGNVNTVFNEKVSEFPGPGITTYLAPEIITQQDYLPFGLTWKRNTTSAGEPNYRYGFNGKE
ncbi:MAG: hypothetical protein AAGJ82_10090, partial [Bacteroidota bacterium]